MTRVARSTLVEIYENRAPKINKEMSDGSLLRHQVCRGCMVVGTSAQEWMRMKMSRREIRDEDEDE